MKTEHNYTYEIIEVDNQAKCMLVRYHMEGRPDVDVGMLMPVEGESLEATIHAYNPIPQVLRQETPLQAISVGRTGTGKQEIYTPDPPGTPGAVLTPGTPENTAAQLEEARIMALIQRVLVSMSEGTV